MAYSGSVDLISGLRPKNNGTFPLINAPDVLVGEEDDTRLDEALRGKDEKMRVFTDWPENFEANGLYELGAQTGTKTVVLGDGANADDMLYISVRAAGRLVLMPAGNNFAGLPQQIEAGSGAFTEIIAIWNSAAEKWLVSWRTISE